MPCAPPISNTAYLAVAGEVWYWLWPTAAALLGLTAGRWSRRKREAVAPERRDEVGEAPARLRLALECAGAGWWQWDRARDEVRSDARVAAWLGRPEGSTETLARWLGSLGPVERRVVEQALREAGGARRRGAFDLRPPGGGATLRFSYEVQGGPAESCDRIEAVVTELSTAPAAPVTVPAALKGALGGGREGYCLLELHPPVAVWEAPEKLHADLLGRARILYCNDAFAALSGAPAATGLLGRPLAEALAAEAGALGPLVEALVRTQFRLEHWPSPAVGPAGTTEPRENSLHGILQAGQLQQIWWRRRPLGAAGPQSERSSWQLAFLTRVVQAVVSAQERTDLLQALCRAAVEAGEFAGAWVTLTEPGGLQAVASFGISHGTLQTLAGEAPWWTELAQRCLSSGEMQLFGPEEPRPAALEARQIQALVVLPLHFEGQASAAWFLERNAVQPELLPDLGLLGELTRLVAYGLRQLQHETRHNATEEQLRALRGDYRDYLVQRTRDLRSVLVRFARTPRPERDRQLAHSPPPSGPLEKLVELAPDLGSELERELNPEEERHLQEVQAEAGQLVGLCRNLLDRVQIEAGHLRLHRESFDFASMVQDVVGLLAPLARQRGLNLQAVTEKPRLPIIGDRRRVQQVLLNLVDNAVKFTFHGEVGVRARFDDAELVFEVSDTGTGLSEAELADVFAAFGKDDVSQRRRRLGDPAGLGLHLCWRLVDRMGGRIAAESRLGQGSVFRVWLPRRAPVEDADAAGESV